MEILSYGYNVPMVFLSTAIAVDTKTKVGTIEQFKQLLAMVSASGIMRVCATLGTQYMNGALIASPWAAGDGIEAFTITKAGDSAVPYIVSVELELEDDGVYATASITTLS